MLTQKTQAVLFGALDSLYDNIGGGATLESHLRRTDIREARAWVEGLPVNVTVDSITVPAPAEENA